MMKTSDEYLLELGIKLDAAEAVATTAMDLFEIPSKSTGLDAANYNRIGILTGVVLDYLSAAQALLGELEKRIPIEVDNDWFEAQGIHIESLRVRASDRKRSS